MSSHRKSEHTASMFSAVGGAPHPIVEIADQLGFEFVAAFDTSQELPQIDVSYTSSLVAKWTLAPQETVATLLDKANAPQSIRDAFAKRPGIGLGAGLGQIRYLGKTAGQLLAGDPEYRRWIKHDFLQRLLMAHPHGINCIKLCQILGASGATGSGAHLELERPLVEEISNATGARIHQTKFLVGMMAYLLLGENVIPNAGATTADLLDWAAGKDRRPLETRMLTCLELPSCGQNSARRDMFLTLAMTAALANPVQSLLDLVMANESLRSSCGAVVQQGNDFFGAITTAEIAADVARSYLPVIRRVRRAAADSKLVRAIDLDPQTTPQPRLPIDSLLGEAYALGPDEIVNAACAPGEQIKVSAAAELATGKSLRLDRLNEYYVGSCPTPEEFETRLSEMRSIARVLSHEINESARVIEDKRLAKSDANQRLLRAIEVLKGQSWWSFAVSDASKELRLIDTATAARSAADGLRRFEADHRALENSAEQVTGEIVHLEEKLGRLQGALERLVPKGQASNGDLLVQPVPLPLVFDGLLQAVRPGATTRVAQIAARCVETVTLAGLAATVGAASPRLDDVIDAIRTPRFVAEGPAWGGKPEDGKAPLQITVLPPVTEALASNLARYLHDLDPTRLVTFADTAKTGVIGAVHLKYRFPRTARKAVTPILKHAIAEALAHEPDLFFPWGTQCLDRIGVQVKPADSRAH